MKPKHLKKNIIHLIISILMLVSVWNYELAAEEKPDYRSTKGWKTVSPESQGVDSRLLLTMLDKIWEKDFAIDSILVIRNGYAVLDAYRYPVSADDKRHIQSCSKSVVSSLVGIAIDKGFIKDVNQHILDYFPKRSPRNLDAYKQAMTIENLLTMTHGLECNDLYGLSGLTDLSAGSDWVQLIIDLPMAATPGTRFAYCNGAAFLLSAILQEQTGMSTLAFAEKHLFAPLGISDVHWPSNPQGITVGYNGLRMRPHDMAKIGYLYLNNGLWNGRQVISPHWINASTRKHSTTYATLGSGYGYQWWIVAPGIYSAVGAQGQYITVLPGKNMLVVFTGSLSRKDITIPSGLLSVYIMPAVKSQTCLPENPESAKALKTALTRWQDKRPADRGKKKTQTDGTQRSRHKTYVSSENGFSVSYDAELLIVDAQLESPLVFRSRGLRGLPIFSVIVDDIPESMALEYTADYLIETYEKIFPTAYHNAYHRIVNEELIKLSDGKDANYVEINWKVAFRGILRTTGVFVYEDKKIIGTVAGSMESTPIKYLAEMARSLRFNP